MKLVLILLLALITFNTVQAKKCRAIAFSGGGDKGAYEAAVFVGLVNSLPAEEVSYDVITGVSAGSLNTLALAVFEPSDVQNAADFAFGLWNSIPNYNAYGNWPGGILQGLFFKKGIFDFAPGFEWVKANLGDLTVKRKVSFATVDANGATYKVWDYNATYTQPADLVESAFASSSIPGAFPHITRGELELIDGGVIWNLDIASAVRRCKEIVDDEKDIIVDMVLCGNHKIDKKVDIEKYSTFQHIMRGRELSSFYNGMSDYNTSLALFPEVNFRYLIVPSENIDSGLIPLNFNQKQVDQCFRVGKKDAENAVKLGHFGYAAVSLDYTERLMLGEDVWLNDMLEEKLTLLEQESKLKSK
jgi:predicted patatin/cPLA2 family phospholipase